MFPEARLEMDACQTDWWKNLLYVNNFTGIEVGPPHLNYYKIITQYIEGAIWLIMAQYTMVIVHQPTTNMVYL